jgi:hypothetical protein
MPSGNKPTVIGTDSSPQAETPTTTVVPATPAAIPPKKENVDAAPVPVTNPLDHITSQVFHVAEKVVRGHFDMPTGRRLLVTAYREGLSDEQRKSVAEEVRRLTAKLRQVAEAVDQELNIITAEDRP